MTQFKKMILSSFLIFATFAVFAQQADDKKGMQKSDGPKAEVKEQTRPDRYLVIAPHTAEECAAVLTEINDQGPAHLARWDFTCAAGEHVGYVTFMGTEQDVKNKLPKSIQPKAKVIKVEKYNRADIEKFHDHKQ